MNSLGRTVLLLMIPLNLVLLAWAWFGRIFFGAGGWFMVFLIFVVPFVFLALVVTSVLGFTQSGRPRALTRSQAVAHIVLWVALFGFGFFLVDFGDMENSDLSVFTQLVGRNDATLSISWTVAGICTLAILVSWAVLLVLLVVQRRQSKAQQSPYGATVA